MTDPVKKVRRMQSWIQQNQTPWRPTWKDKTEEESTSSSHVEVYDLCNLHDESNTVEVAKDHGLQGRWSLNENKLTT